MGAAASNENHGNMNGIIEQEERIIRSFADKYSTGDDGSFVGIIDKYGYEKLIMRNDAIVLLRALIKQELASYTDDGDLSHYQPNVDVRTDEHTKKITCLYLIIGAWNSSAKGQLDVDLIRPLTRLNSLQVWGFYSIRSSQNSSLNQIRRLEINCNYIDRDETTGTRIFQLLPNLEKLEFSSMRYIGEEKIATMIHDLQNHSAFRVTLKELIFCGFSFNHQQTSTFLLDIPSEFKKLSFLRLNCNISSLKSIVDVIEHMIGNGNGNKWQPSKNIRRLNLAGNPVGYKLKQDRDEIIMMLTYLRLHVGLYSLGIPRNKHHSEIERQLKINHAGRKLLGGNSRTGKPPVAKALYATVLEQSYKTSDHVWNESDRRNSEHDATGLYDLLRNGPFL